MFPNATCIVTLLDRLPHPFVATLHRFAGFADATQPPTWHTARCRGYLSQVDTYHPYKWDVIPADPFPRFS